jgi:uncharacterized membrane protein YbhN (UPF0104 family)
MRRLAAIAVGLLLSGICLAIAASSVSWEQFSGAFHDISYGWLAFAALLQVSTMLLRTYRWELMFSGKPGFATLFWTQAIGYLANNLLPLRLGDLARIMLLRLLIAISAVRIGYTIVVERYLDVALTLVLLVVTTAFAPTSRQVWLAAAIFFFIMVLATACAAGLYFYGRARGEIMSTPLIRKIVLEFVSAVDLTFRNRPMATFLSSAACTAFSVLMVWAVLKGFNPAATFWTAMVLTVTITFALAVPSGPANVGTFQLAGQAALVSLFRDSYTPAVGLAIVSVVHLIHFLGTSVLGLAGAWWLRRRLGGRNALRELMTKLMSPSA